MEAEPLTQISAIVKDFGIWALFAWLFIHERALHTLTREKYLDDLREIANMKPTLAHVKDFPASNEVS